MSHLGKSCDTPITANYCIVSGVPSQYFNGGTIHDNIFEKLRKAVAGRSVISKACEDALADIKHKRRKALRLSNMEWKAINIERAFVLVKLDAPIMVGTTMKGRTRRYERILVTKPDKDNKGGEFFQRQFVDDDEVQFLLAIEGLSNIDVILSGVRGLPRVTEIDDAVLRDTKNTVAGQVRGKLGVFVMSITHDWAQANGAELKEEPILVVCTMDGGHRDGKELGRSCDVYKHGDMIARHPYGSFEVQYFQEVDRVLNRPVRGFQGSWVMEVDLRRGSDMLDLLKLLNDDEASRMHSVVRMEEVGGELDRWCIVMTQKGVLQNSMRVMVEIRLGNVMSCRQPGDSSSTAGQDCTTHSQ